MPVLTSPRTLFLLLSLCAGCRSQVLHGLDERDANELVSVLATRGFEVTKKAEAGKKPTWALEVPDSESIDAMRVLSELKLPRPRALLTKDVVSQTSLIDTPAAERLRQLEAQEGDLEQALESMDGVTSASVELVLPPAPRPGQAPTPSKAAVLIRVQPDALERLQQERAELRALVAAGVDGLKPDDVIAVIDVVTSQVVLPSERVDTGSRTLATVLSAVLGVLALILGGLGLRVRLGKPRVIAPVAPAPAVKGSPRPIVAAGLQRAAPGAG